MHIITGKTIRACQDEYPQAAKALQAWHYEAKHAKWESPDDIKRKYGNASIITGNRVVFNICGNRYRLVVHVKYQIGRVYVRFFGTHKEYDAICAEEV